MRWGLFHCLAVVPTLKTPPMPATGGGAPGPMASMKVGAGLAYHAAVRWVMGHCFCSRWAASATQEKSPINTGVVRPAWCDRRGAGDGPVGPLTLGFHSQMRPHLLEGDLQLPAQHKPFQDLCRSHCRVGTEQRLGVEFAFGVSNQYPTNGHGWFAGVIPERRLRGEFRPADSTVIPSHRGGIPGDSRQAKLLCPKLLFQSGQTHALHPGPAFLARQPGRHRSIETGIQPQPGDSTW